MLGINNKYIKKQGGHYSVNCYGKERLEVFMTIGGVFCYVNIIDMPGLPDYQKVIHAIKKYGFKKTHFTHTKEA